ncbi:phosphoribosylformylglycinamidine synthase-like isoform X2 [Ostrea edulis]|uniref:phosphoribosylformylglycinamidine synthase-like isoform X2 n=1 Tax=Ostrea edulis TaxID=37623 RepID=UPI0024AEA37F|nr:phosphoribosylformylglycinamidine synthase-like isoform X2 [Ostrea edulis]
MEDTTCKREQPLLLKLYKKASSCPRAEDVTYQKMKSIIGDDLHKVQIETCYYIQFSSDDVDLETYSKLVWILSTPFRENDITRKSSFEQPKGNTCLIEIGPRLNFSTPFSTNTVSICKSAGIKDVTRVEFSTRYLMTLSEDFQLDGDEEQRVVDSIHDKMTQCRYVTPVETFALEVRSEDVYEIDILGEGRQALVKANEKQGLAFDEWDLDYYTELFQEKIKRNPTNVECFDLAQSNSEHSRHWFFRGRLVVDGKEHPESLFKMIMDTQKQSNPNNVIKFSDNSSAIKGYETTVLVPSDTTVPSAMSEMENVKRHIIFTAETHNFPTGVAPFPGATTGTGGRIRDVQCTGKGAHVVAGTAGYSFGNLNIPGYIQPWEDQSHLYPGNFASPLNIAIEASNGASDYGNKFGEPVLAGFARSYGLTDLSGERREYIKPIMFSGGIGQLEDIHVKKNTPETGMLVTKVGGPVYRIGVGGGAASSVQVQGDNKEELDFGAVQRGDPEMEQKLNRVIRACIERREKNPIASVHDQGAGGNGNVLKEIAEPAGALIQASRFQLGDPTLSILELWGAEYQESNALLISPRDQDLVQKIADRERCPVNFVGTITGDGRIKLDTFKKETISVPAKKRKTKAMNLPVDLELEHVLGSMPRKVFKLERTTPPVYGLSLPENLQIRDGLERVLRLPSVASKRYLTNKVDRCVTGLVAQQQCVGSLHTPLADVAVTALSYLDKVGSCTAIGEQPVKGLINAACGARLSVGEALTNLVFAKVTDIKDIKCSGNWMWPAKLPGEGNALLEACSAMCDIMKDLGIAVDGGKDSLSMAARVGSQTVKSPGTLVISAYAACPDIMMTVTPDLKCPDNKGCLLLVDLADGNHRLGGSALAQCYKQLGDLCPDLDQPEVFRKAFNVTQKLIGERKVSAGHDVSDGGLVTAVLEMALAGNCGIDVNLEFIQKDCSAIDVLFSEELGLILEVPFSESAYVLGEYATQNVPCYSIGHSCKQSNPSDAVVNISIRGNEVMKEKMTILRDIWEETSFQLERHQANPKCVAQEQAGLKERVDPPYHVPYESEIISFTVRGRTTSQASPKVAVLREEGSNSDREMAAVLHLAGFEVWDVNMEDLCTERISLDQFRGLVFVGGFSYADVCGSAKGWAATALFNQSVREQLLKFKERPDTFSLGVCNGCQLMALLGWVAPDEDLKENSNSGVGQGLFLDHNLSERFECRFSTVKIMDSPAMMFRGMKDTMFGMWSAHGEGRMVFRSEEIYQDVCRDKLIAVKYVDDLGKPTEVYPFNPNGSRDGIAAICSEDGRHLAIMPHPERCFLPWQCAWMPQEMRRNFDVSPWFKMFQNAFDWCREQ